MSKYEPLGNYLRAQKSDRVTLSLDEIADIIGDTLPASARKFVAWWENEAQGSHVQARAWVDEGFKTEGVSLTSESVTFVRE
jgi:hypothetical protein